MEQLSSLAGAASKAIWGTETAKDDVAHKEPMSGVQGDTSKGEPFDAGNIENLRIEDTADAEPCPKTKTAAVESDDKSAGGGDNINNKDTATPSDNNPAATGTGTSNSDENSSAGNNANDINNNNNNNNTASGGEYADSPENNSDKPVRNPSAEKTTNSTKPVSSADDGQGVAAGDDAALQGPGPKPVAEVAREHGGDAGNATPTREIDEAKEEAAEKPDGENPEAAAEAAAESKKKEQEEQGTGEEYVRSTGLAADGGDFDASKPGAGAEADRIMEEKHIRSADPEHDESTSHNKEKHGLRAKIKAKLHRHHDTDAAGIAAEK